MDPAALDARILERLRASEWTRTLGPFGAFDQRFVIRTTDDALADFIDEAYASLALAPHTVAADAGRETAVSTSEYYLLPPTLTGRGAVFRDEELIGTSRRPSRVLGYLGWAINQQVIARSLDRLVFHAAAAALGNLAVILPAPMESGKTTLVAGLLDCGLSYMTDEAAAVDPNLTVSGYAKPLSIDAGSWHVLQHHQPRTPPSITPYVAHQWQVSASRLGSITASAQLGLIVLPQYQRGAGVSLRRVNPAEGVRRMAASTFVPEGERLQLWRIKEIAAIVSQVPTYTLLHDDLQAASERVKELLGKDGNVGQGGTRPARTAKGRSSR